MTQQFKFVEVTHEMSTVFMIPADWDEEKIRIVGEKLRYKNKTVSPIIDSSDYDFRNYEILITPDGHNHDSEDYDFEEYLYEKPKKEIMIEK